MSGIETIAAIAGLAGTAVSTAGTLATAGQQSAALEFEAKQRRQQAQEAEASAQRAAAARYREGRILASRQAAVAAATSGDTTEQSVINIMGNTARETELAAGTEMYKGLNQAKGFRDAAMVADTNARSSLVSGTLGAFGTALSGVSSMYSRFGQSKAGGGSAKKFALPYE